MGHATRCIPIINELLKQGFNPIIASDGIALQILQKEFPQLKSIDLPSYKIKYPKNGKRIKWKLLLAVPSIIRAVFVEKSLVEKLIISEELSGIISDNRFGVRNYNIPSVVITHQLNVLSGVTTFITSKVHEYLINKFEACWVPDEESNPYSGKLSKSTKIKNQKFIGILSRFEKEELPKKYDLLVLLSGIEPLRSQLEKKLLDELKQFDGNVLFVQGKLAQHQKKQLKNNITIINFLLTDELQQALNESELVIARSGYSTIMDLAALGKKAFFIPTSGQYEQEYLAQHLMNNRITSFSSQKEFKIEMLQQVKNFTGFNNKSNQFIFGEKSIDSKELFHFFHRK